MREENITPYTLDEEDENTGFDYKAFLVQLLMHWPWLLVSIIVFTTASYFYVKTLT